MAQNSRPHWDRLPSIIMIKIFSYLKPKDRINASVVCKDWRQAYFHPLFWKNITFLFNNKKTAPWSRYLADRFALSVEKATVKCDINCCIELACLLENLCRSRNLRKLMIEPSLSTSQWVNGFLDLHENETLSKSIHLSIISIIKNTKRLETLTLGCVEDITLFAREILECLSSYHSEHLTHLGLASVKEIPDNYKVISLDSLVFNNFKHLTILTIDYDHLNDILLDSFTTGTLERLVVHVHDWHQNRGASNRSWILFTHNNPRCEMRINFLHAYAAILYAHSDILKPAMPLTHFKALFCEKVNVRVMYALVAYYYRTLRSVIWIDSINEEELFPPSDAQSNPDGLVFIAWRCFRLEELVYIGHKYFPQNMLAIARLRGDTLQKCEFSENDMMNESDTSYKLEEIYREINKILGAKWKIYSYWDLLPVLTDPFKGDSRDVIMPLIIDDVK
ncbi:F-box only protein 33 [Chelonus insularis]|uniref:F-box only protein 33 n=1 Tax=Chelonus insularis TaxID=460826 RepID=UPI0015893A9D|nr:F-box only protein 33 [Chelonus insularis]